MPRIKKNEPECIRRSKSVWGAVYVALAVLAAGTAWIQLNPDIRVVRQSQKQYWASVAVSASRGEIIDRNGIPLAVSVPATSFFIDPKYWDPKSADLLTGPFGESTAKKFRRGLTGRFHWVARNVPKEKADSLFKNEIPGLYTISERIRVYPHGELASHVLGFCDIDDYGQAGVELAWNHILYSPPRTRFLTRDSKGKTLDIMGGKSGVLKNTSGTIKLTLDSRIQQIMEWRLSEGAKSANASWGAGVCVDPLTGEILALASYPSLDPNDRTNLKDQDAVRNNVVGRVFEPGSIFKPITMSIAIETAAANKNSHYNCRGTMKLADKTMSDVNKKAHGMQDLTHVLMNSCNIGMSLMSMGVPRHQAYGMLRQFGFGEKTEVELAGEESGLIKSPEEWLGTVPANIFIGQGIAVTPLQAVMAIGSIANGGSLLKPYLIAEVLDTDGKVIHKGGRRVRYQVMSPATSEFMRAAMKRVVSEGGGKMAYSPKVSIAGKTGTAQIAAAGEYSKGHYVASFVGFWPEEKPRYVMMISLGEPKGARYYGGQIAAPIFKSIAEDIMQISPSGNGPMRTKAN
jgi:cell division protein FtsI (penicillin-binding protein 3)/stage V sporulation protein D (sporulation-specific penicillin-binding protein)